MNWTYNATEHVPACNLCGSPPSRWTTFATRDRAGFPATSVACRRCGLIFITPRMSAADYDLFYRSGAYRRTTEKVLGKPYDAEHMRRGQRYYAKALCEWLKKVAAKGIIRVGPESSYLDIGGSTGICAAELCKALGMRTATVLDPATEELEHARSLGLETEYGALETWEPSGRRWNVVSMLQTVDHLLDIAGSLRKIRTILAPGGLFMMDIVDAGWMLRWCRKYKAPIRHACKIDHPHGLTPLVMQSYLERAGFVILTTGHTDNRKHVFFVCRAIEDWPRKQWVESWVNEICEVRDACVLS